MSRLLDTGHFRETSINLGIVFGCCALCFSVAAQYFYQKSGWCAVTKASSAQQSHQKSGWYAGTESSPVQQSRYLLLRAGLQAARRREVKGLGAFFEPESGRTGK